MDRSTQAGSQDPLDREFVNIIDRLVFRLLKLFDRRRLKMHLNTPCLVVKRVSMWMEVLLRAQIFPQSALRKALSAPSGKSFWFALPGYTVISSPRRLDPSVRITYHPRVKKTTRSGFYNKTTIHLYTQRVTIFNTKTTAAGDLKITDQFPVSDDSIITVKQISPGLVDVLKASTSGEVRLPEKVSVTSGVYAQWNGADEPDVNIESLGKDGKFDWVCSVPPQGKIELFLQYEVIVPPRLQVMGI